LVVAVQTGLRVAELTGLRCHDIVLGTGAHVRCYGKGRKERCTPLTRPTVSVLRVWIAELGHIGDQPVWPTRRGGPLNPDSVGDLIDRHVNTARENFPDWTTKKVTPHTLRHTTAMTLLAAGVDTSVIAMWLGHEHTQTTQIYLHGDLTMKERALARTAPLNTPPGRYQAPDTLLAFLEAL
jgi:site-specific recombinase XerD